MRIEKRILETLFICTNLVLTNPEFKDEFLDEVREIDAFLGSKLKEMKLAGQEYVYLSVRENN